MSLTSGPCRSRGAADTRCWKRRARGSGDGGPTAGAWMWVGPWSATDPDDALALGAVTGRVRRPAGWGSEGAGPSAGVLSSPLSSSASGEGSRPPHWWARVPGRQPAGCWWARGSSWSCSREGMGPSGSPSSMGSAPLADHIPPIMARDGGRPPCMLPWTPELCAVACCWLPWTAGGGGLVGPCSCSSQSLARPRKARGGGSGGLPGGAGSCRPAGCAGVTVCPAMVFGSSLATGKAGVGGPTPAAAGAAAGDSGPGGAVGAGLPGPCG